MVTRLILSIFLSIAVSAASISDYTIPTSYGFLNNFDELVVKYKVSKTIPIGIATGEIILALTNPEELKAHSYCVLKLDLLQKYSDTFNLPAVHYDREFPLHVSHGFIPYLLNFMDWLEAIDSGHQVNVPNITYNLARFIDHIQFSKNAPCYQALYTEVARYLLDPVKADLLNKMPYALYYDCINLDLPGEIAQKAVALWKVAKDFLKPGHPLFSLAISYEDALSDLDFYQKYIIASMAEAAMSDCDDLFLAYPSKVLVIDCEDAVAIPDKFLCYSNIPQIIFMRDQVISIGALFLYWCNELTSLILPAGVEQIEDWFLKNCVKLTSLTLPPALKEIQQSFLAGFLDSCYKLQDIFVEKSSDTDQLLSTDYRFKKIRPKIKRMPTNVTQIFARASVEHQLIEYAQESKELEHEGTPRQLQYMADPNVMHQQPQ